MSRSVATAQLYIDKIKKTQWEEQNLIAAKRGRGINGCQKTSPLFPILIYTLDLNQSVTTPILTDLQRDNIIDYLI